jgi:Fibrillar collagen C-terminal domain
MEMNIEMILRIIVDQQTVISNKKTVISNQKAKISNLEVRRFREHSSFIHSKVLYSLQEIVQRQELKIAELERKIDEPSKSNGALRSTEKEGKAALYRSCEELRSADPESKTGGHWIDPDGVATGDPPIFVQCDMTTGSSRFIHSNILQLISFFNRIHFHFT